MDGTGLLYWWESSWQRLFMVHFQILGNLRKLWMSLWGPRGRPLSKVAIVERSHHYAVLIDAVTKSVQVLSDVCIGGGLCPYPLSSDMVLLTSRELRSCQELSANLNWDVTDRQLTGSSGLHVFRPHLGRSGRFRWQSDFIHEDGCYFWNVKSFNVQIGFQGENNALLDKERASLWYEMNTRWYHVSVLLPTTLGYNKESHCREYCCIQLPFLIIIQKINMIIVCNCFAKTRLSY